MQRDLVVRAASGDRDAFTALVGDAFDRLHRVARLILRSDDLAADAVQEALVSAWLHIRAVRDPDRFDAWLHRLVVHACYREARRLRRRGIVEIHVNAFEAPASFGAPAAVDAAGDVVERDQLARGFQRLTPEQRAVLVVHHYLGLSDAEAARVLDIPVGTLKSRLSRATSALRAALDADERSPVVTKESIA
jgi:RNA polymerase sigma-70 factor, ECF subfamily